MPGDRTDLVASPSATEDVTCRGDLFRLEQSFNVPEGADFVYSTAGARLQEGALAKATYHFWVRTAVIVQT